MEYLFVLIKFIFDQSLIHHYDLRCPPTLEVGKKKKAAPKAGQPLFTNHGGEGAGHSPMFTMAPKSRAITKANGKAAKTVKPRKPLENNSKNHLQGV